MNSPLRREDIDEFEAWMAEKRSRQAKAKQSSYGWYDEDGVRQGGLIAFVRYFWHVLEPETPFVDGWVLWAMCEHLEAVTQGKIIRLLINVPPGCMKSLLVDVFWPAWEAGPMDLAHLRYVAFAYAASLTERDNGRYRDLITSREYQELWGDRVSIIKKGDTKVSNNQKGWKFASSVTGVGTGERGDRIILDDPHNVKDSESEIVRNETARWFRESMSSRLNNMETGVIVIIMQRVHADDVSGVIADLRLDYVHLCIPMEFDWTYQTLDGEPRENAIGWYDPRYDGRGPNYCEGKLAWRERFPLEVVTRIKAEVGPYAWAGQYQQQPAPRGGGIFKRAWWQLWDSPNGGWPELHYIWASLDGAFTEKETNSPSALTIWGTFTDPESKHRRIILIHAWRKFLQFSGPRIQRLERDSVISGRRFPAEALVPGLTSQEVKYRNKLYWMRTQDQWGLIEWLAHSCSLFKVDKLLIEGKASGMSAAQELRNRYSRAPWSVQLCSVSGDKYARALAVQPMFSNLMIYAPVRDWAEMVIEEMEVFPKGKYADLTDSTSQALKYARDVGLADTDEEAQATEIERVTHRPKQKALYPV